MDVWTYGRMDVVWDIIDKLPRWEKSKTIGYVTYCRSVRIRIHTHGEAATCYPPTASLKGPNSPSFPYGLSGHA